MFFITVNIAFSFNAHVFFQHCWISQSFVFSKHFSKKWWVDFVLEFNSVVSLGCLYKINNYLSVVWNVAYLNKQETCTVMCFIFASIALMWDGSLSECARGIFTSHWYFALGLYLCKFNVTLWKVNFWNKLSTSFKLVSTVIFTPKKILLGFQLVVHNFQHHHLDLPSSFKDLNENAADCFSCVGTTLNNSEFWRHIFWWCNWFK